MLDESMSHALLEVAGVGSGASIAPLPGGTVNQAFLVERRDHESLVLRIAPSDEEAADGPGWLSSHGLRREQQVLALVGDALPDLVPRTMHFDESRELIDRDWVLQMVVPGRPWSDVLPELDAGEHLRLWRELGALVHDVHAIVGAEFGPPEVGFGTATWSDLVRWDVTGFAVDARRLGIDPDPLEALCALVDDAASLLDEVDEPRLIHSDLGLNHIFLVPERGGRSRISGIIDWEYGRFADPQSESVFRHHAPASRSDEELAAFCEGYGCPESSARMAARAAIYRLMATGWEITDLARQGRMEQAAEALALMSPLLDEARRHI